MVRGEGGGFRTLENKLKKGKVSKFDIFKKSSALILKKAKNIKPRIKKKNLLIFLSLIGLIFAVSFFGNSLKPKTVYLEPKKPLNNELTGNVVEDVEVETIDITEKESEPLDEPVEELVPLVNSWGVEDYKDFTFSSTLSSSDLAIDFETAELHVISDRYNLFFLETLGDVSASPINMLIKDFDGELIIKDSKIKFEGYSDKVILNNVDLRLRNAIKISAELNDATISFKSYVTADGEITILDKVTFKLKNDTFRIRESDVEFKVNPNGTFELRGDSAALRFNTDSLVVQVLPQ